MYLHKGHKESFIPFIRTEIDTNDTQATKNQFDNSTQAQSRFQRGEAQEY